MKKTQKAKVAPTRTPSDRKAAAAELGRKGGKKGGKARAAKLSAAERKKAASLAAQKRWDIEKGVQYAIYDGQLELGDQSFDCAIVRCEDGKDVRVLSQTTVTTAFGRHRPGGRGGNATGGLPVLVSAKNLQPYISDELHRKLSNPILYRGKERSGGQPALGIEATMLADICVVFIEAEKQGALTPQQKKAAAQATILHRALAKTGITALIDEATGYQLERDKNSLAELLKKYITEEAAAWVKMFPKDYYVELCRLRNIPFKPNRRFPQYMGKITNNIVYDRLAPGVKEALDRKNPVEKNGHRKHKHHQWLTLDDGHPMLKEHLTKVVTTMKLSDTYEEFMENLDKVAEKQKNDTKKSE